MKYCPEHIFIPDDFQSRACISNATINTAFYVQNYSISCISLTRLMYNSEQHHTHTQPDALRGLGFEGLLHYTKANTNPEFGKGTCEACNSSCKTFSIVVSELKWFCSKFFFQILNVPSFPKEMKSEKAVFPAIYIQENGFNHLFSI